ncbi:hypothetical protein EH220_04550 [bacterium]|nr:MAG: hypothetical protein EH220_04550 [bacterium]
MSEGLAAIREILDSKIKPKEKTGQLVEQLGGSKALIKQLVESFDQLKKPEQGTCISALTVIAEENPALLKEHIGFCITQIGHKAPRVKWEASQIIGHLAKAYPDKVKDAIPALKQNTEDEGTVVRWSTAFALTEIAKSNPAAHTQLVTYIKKLEQSEENNGVRKIYTKALKTLQKA